MKEMPLEDHLAELRTTLIRIIVIWAVSFVITYTVSDQISEFLLIPLRKALAHTTDGKIIYLGLLDKMLAQIQVAVWSSVILSSPFLFRELWMFIRPGLYEFEIRVVRPFIVVGFCLFALGIFFGYYIVFPFTFETLMNFGVANVEAALGLKEYLIMCSKVLVLLGFVFQFPNILLILGFMGVVTKYSLRAMRRYIYVVLAIVAAILTPPDVVSMMALWIPLTILFEVGILAVALIVHPYLAKQHSS